MKRILGLCCLALLTVSCAPQQEPIEKVADCAINPGKYDVQTASFIRSSETYELFVMGAQPCVKQPVALQNLQMAQLNVEGDAKEAKVEIRGDQSILYMSKNFSLDLVNETVGADGQVSREQSMWTPFLAGAAGMVAGQMISNAFFNKPRHYQPPVMQPGQSRASGFGGFGDTPQEAKSSYQNTLAKSGLQGTTPNSNLKPQSNVAKAQPAAKPAPKRKLAPRKVRKPFGIRKRR